MENQSMEITIYGTSWCGDTIRARSLFEKNKIEYKWIDIDQDIEGRKLVESINHGNRSVPTIVFPDGAVLVEPSTSELAKKIGV